ncbi:hypothetical protein KJA16_01350 [Patescibacteria group bacterium]|nr:hypothetical protein [Patescibacteria group bacterium]
MPKENMPEKISNEILKELVKLIESEDTALEITRICFENGVKEEEKIREIGYQTGRVLLGDLSPEELPKILTEKAKLSSFLAEKIAREINESIFNPVKANLEELYKIEIAPSAGVVPSVPKTAIPEEKPTPPKADIYREPVEQPETE